MQNITYKSLFQHVVEEIDKRVEFNTKSSYDKSSHTDKNSLSLINDASRADASLSEIIAAIQSTLDDALPSQILSGLEVTATNPITDTVKISKGKGTVGGRVYILNQDTEIVVPFNTTNFIFYITLGETVQVEQTYSDTKLTLAKIVVPHPRITNVVQDESDGSWTPYIVNFKEYKFYGYNNKFEEDSIELLRDNIGDILADNLIGNIRLSENLKITNTQNTLTLDSTSLTLTSFISNLDRTLAKFDRNGVFFYDLQGTTVAKFGSTEAYIGNILITKNSLQSRNYIEDSIGFRIQDSGDVEFNNMVIRGTIYALAGEVGGWTIASNSIYATTTGTIKTSLNAGAGANGVVIDKDGLRVYDDVLGVVVNLPSDGSAPSFASGIIESTIFEIDTNAVIRTSDTVGDGSANSEGILINNTGIYGCEANQTLNSANLKALINGDVFLKGEIVSEQGTIGGVTITSTSLSGGLIEGSTLRGTVIETSSTTPRVRIDSNGVYYQETTEVGKYGSSGVYGFKYGDGTNYGSGVTAYLFKENLPLLAIMAERNSADIRLYNRTDDPTTGIHVLGDIICVDGLFKRCTVAGSPGTFEVIGDGATKALDNLASVAINTSLISDTDNTDDLGSSSNEWRDLYVDGTAYIDAIDLNGTSLTTLLDAKLDTLLTAAPTSDHTASGMKITLVAHENVVFGDVCYINSSGEAQIIDADAIATMSGLVMAIATINADASGLFLLMGIARDDTWNWTVGGLIYGTVTGTSTNTLSQTAPTGTDDVVQILGVATHADRMYFNPQLVQVEHT